MDKSNIKPLLIGGAVFVGLATLYAAYSSRGAQEDDEKDANAAGNKDGEE